MPAQENYETVGRIWIISTCLTESRMKSAVKTPARKTNNQASFGGSILKNNMEVEAAMELQRHLDETGVHQVHTIYAWGFFGFAPCSSRFFLGLHHVWLRKTFILSKLFGSYQVYKVYTKFTPCLHKVYFPTGFFFWGKTPVGKMQTLYKLCINFEQT